MPKFTAFALRRMSGVTINGGDAEYLGRGARVDILAVAERVTSSGSFDMCASSRSSICE